MMIKSTITAKTVPPKTPEYPKLVVSGFAGTVAMQINKSEGFIVGATRETYRALVGNKVTHMDRAGNTWNPYHGTVELSNEQA